MSFYEVIAETIEPPPETKLSRKERTVLFERLKKNIKDLHGLDWEKVKDWKYVGGFKHPDKVSDIYCSRTEKLERVFNIMYPETGKVWLEHLKSIEAKDECYCSTPIHWNYIIVEDPNVFNCLPSEYDFTTRKFLIIGCHCVKRLDIATPLTICLKCKKGHRNTSTELCNDCRTDGKWAIFSCDYCKTRGDKPLSLNWEKKRKCSACIEKPKPKVKKTYYKCCKWCNNGIEEKDIKKKLWDKQFRKVEGIICKHCCVNCGGYTSSQKNDTNKHYLYCYNCSKSIYSH